MHVRFYAVGREIAGCTEYTSAATSVTELRADLETRFGARMAQLFDASSVLHAGQRLGSDSQIIIGSDDVVDLLPPFAGG